MRGRDRSMPRSSRCPREPVRQRLLSEFAPTERVGKLTRTDSDGTIPTDDRAAEDDLVMILNYLGAI
jgi:hypothetical protein